VDDPSHVEESAAAGEFGVLERLIAGRDKRM
jgi:hypothetical protein